jgi:SPRY domain
MAKPLQSTWETFSCMTTPQTDTTNRSSHDFGFTEWVTQLTRWCPSVQNPSSPKAASWSYFGFGNACCYPFQNPFSDKSEPLPPFGRGDTVGLGVDFSEKIMFFTKNGERLSNAAFKNINGRLYPCIGLFEKGSFKVNFGDDPSNPFKWVPGRNRSFDTEGTQTETIPAPDGI